MSHKPFRLLMLSAMYENGGNTVHRFLDGHPQMFVYPFESQLGTRMVVDLLSSVFPVKYRWPRFDLSATHMEDYEAIFDEECKVRIKTPSSSKFRYAPIDMSDMDRRELFLKHTSGKERCVGNSLEAFFRSTFDAWKDYKRSGREEVFVGYSPVVVVDADRILSDMEDAHILHVVRNPFSAYADTKKRAVPMSLSSYLTAWVLVQYHACTFSRKYPDRVHVVRFEDVVDDSVRTLGEVCGVLGLEIPETLGWITWNGSRMDEVYPWGTVRIPKAQANRATAEELSDEEREEVRCRSGPFLKIFDYEDFM